jgi:hypothetical protein
VVLAYINTIGGLWKAVPAYGQPGPYVERLGTPYYLFLMAHSQTIKNSSYSDVSPEEAHPFPDNPRTPVEMNAPFPEAIRRNEKAIYVTDISHTAPEPVPMVEDADKHVLYGPEAMAPEAIARESPLYPLHDPIENEHMDESRQDPEPDPTLNKTAHRICGLPRKIFWFLVLVLGILVVGVAIGVPVGTKLSPKSNRPNNSA